ncbi:MAG: S8 family serine peptidase [Thermoanaerobaculaceae bacterium]
MRPKTNTLCTSTGLAFGLWLAMAAPSTAGERVAVMIELRDPPAASVWAQRLAASVGTADAQASAASAAVAHLARLETAQQRVLTALAAPGTGATVLFRLQRALNGIAVEVDRDRLDDLAALDGVRRITRLVPETLDLYSSVPLIQAPQAWTSPGVTGQGVRIGVIDTGVDYLHVGMGGSGSYAGQDYTDATVPWNAKVVGGYDFAGDLYHAGCSDADQNAGRCSRTPTPDPDPMDCNGHGSHVAGIAAGYGVTLEGTTYPGPYSSATPFGTLQIGPGVAPGAQIYALRTFGCSGSSILTAQAIDWSTDPNGDGNFSDHLDVVNLSLGSSYGQLDAASSEAANNAAAVGVIVVASAGNSGDVYYITGSPGVAERAISVANSVDSTELTAGFVVNAPAGLAGVKPAAEAQFGPNLSTTGPITGDLVLADDGSGSGSDACETIVNTAAMSGKIALVDRGTCTYPVKVKNCQTAGARGVLIANNAEGWPFTLTGSDATITIPSMLTDLATGSALKTALAGGTVNVTLTAAYRGVVRAVEPPMVDTLSSSSSRGPVSGTSALKPDLTAPGTTIWSLASRSGSGGRSLSGTSMACPHITGAMALLRQLHPQWTVEELKALLLGTSTHGLFTNPSSGPPAYGPGRVGSGRTDLQLATEAALLASGTDTPGAVSVSFGRPEVIGSWSASRNVSVVNKGAGTITATLVLQTVVDMPGVSFSLPGGSQVNVPGNSSSMVTIQATAEGPQMKRSRDASVASTQGGNPRHWLPEEAAYLLVTAPGQPAQRLAVYAAPRPASTMGTQEASLALAGETGSLTLHLAGQGVATGTSFPTDWVSLASAFELAAESPDETSSQGSDNAQDLRYVGVTSDFARQLADGKGLAETSVFFGVATWADWSSPNKVPVQVLIDTNRDGTDDWVLYSTSTGGASPNDVYAVQLCTLPSGSCSGYFLNAVDAGVRDTALLNSNVMVLPVLPGWLGLTAGNSRFNYRVLTAVDSTPTLTFDPANPGLSFGGASFLGTPTAQPMYTDVAGQAIPVTYSRANLVANGSQGALLLHHHNLAGTRAQVLTTASTCTPTCGATVPESGMIDVAVPFEATVSGQGCTGSTTFDWDFGDGSAHATSASPTHVYTEAGTFTWRVTAAIGGVPCTRSGQITIAPWTAHVPAVAHAPGAAGSQWRTDLAVANRSGRTASLSYVYVPYGAGAQVTRSRTLGHGATERFEDVLVSLFGFAASASPKGSVRIESSARVLVTARTYNQATKGTYGQSYPALTTADGFTRGQTAYVGQLEKSTAFRSNLGVQNLGSTDCAVTATLHDASGATLGNPLTQTVAGGRYFQWDDVFAKAAAPSASLAYAKVRVDTNAGRIWAYGSVVDNITGDPTTVAALWGEPVGPYLVPSVAHAPGAGGSQWRTDLAAVNPDGATQLTLTYTPVQGAAGSPVVRNATLTSGATREWSDLLVSLFGFPATATPKGTVEVASPGSVYLFARTYNQAAAGTYGQSYPSLRATDGLGQGQEGVVLQLSKSTEFRSNLGVQNLGGTACTVAVRLLGPTGAQLGSTLTQSLDAGRFFQWDDVFAKAGAPSQTLAYATVEVQTAGCRVWVYGSVVDNGTGDPTTVPVLVP